MLTTIRFNLPRAKAGLAALMILAMGLTLAGCGPYGRVTPYGIPSGELERILAHPKRFRAYGCAPTIGPRAGEWVAIYWDIRGDGVRVVGEQMPLPDRDRWRPLAPDQVVKIYRAVLDLDRQNETFSPRLYRILDERGRLIGYYFSAIWDIDVPVIIGRPGRYTIREVNLEQFKFNNKHREPFQLGDGFAVR